MDPSHSNMKGLSSSSSSSSKQPDFTNGKNTQDSHSDEETTQDSYFHVALDSTVPQKRYLKKMARAGFSVLNGDNNRFWAIPYRFGKRGAMPYRFGKRAAAMHFRLGKKSV
jgi:hypothetical protein